MRKRKFTLPPHHEPALQGQPADVARVAVFLASEEARYIVGQTLLVDGGTTSWIPFSDAFRQPVTSSFGKGYVPGL